MKQWMVWLLLTALLGLSACSGRPTGQPPPPAPPETRDSAPSGYAIDIHRIPDAVPREEPLSRFGNPESYVVFGQRYYTMASAEGYAEEGIASWYGTKFHGRRTSSGEPYDMFAMTAAHRSLPLPTFVEVTNLENGRTVVVRVNDRGPFVGNRIIDLSYAAAVRLGMERQGTARVKVRAITPGREAAAPVVARASEPVATPAANGVSNGLAEASRYYLQVGAFQSRDNADTLRRRLESLNAGPVLINSGGTPSLYRVRIGPLASSEEADSLVRSLLHHGIDTPAIIAD